LGFLDFGREGPADRVVLQQKRHGVRVAKGVIHRDQLDLGLLAPSESRPVERTADPTESVDADAYRHDVLLSSAWDPRSDQTGEGVRQSFRHVARTVATHDMRCYGL